MDVEVCTHKLTYTFGVGNTVVSCTPKTIRSLNLNAEMVIDLSILYSVLKFERSVSSSCLDPTINARLPPYSKRLRTETSNFPLTLAANVCDLQIPTWLFRARSLVTWIGQWRARASGCFSLYSPVTSQWGFSGARLSRLGVFASQRGKRIFNCTAC